MPKRIQRRRTRGWTKPEGAVYVGRPSIYGNPFSVPLCGRERSIRAFREAVLCGFDPSMFHDLTNDQFHEMYKSYRQWQARTGVNFIHFVREDLRGKDLMCWCRLDEACHADVLLEIANS